MAVHRDLPFSLLFHFQKKHTRELSEILAPPSPGNSEILHKVSMLSSAGQPSFTLGISRPTVRRFLAAEQFPERLSGPKRQRQSIVTPYLPFLRERCQESGTTLKPRRGSRVLWPIFSSSPGSGEAPPVRQETLAPPPGSLILWGDWERCQIRRSFLTLLRTQTVTVTQRAPEDRNVEETEG